VAVRGQRVEIFGSRLKRKMRAKLATVIDRVELKHHVFRAYYGVVVAAGPTVVPPLELMTVPAPCLIN
jgi:hypothetical protein